MSCREIAEVYGMPEDAVRAATRRAPTRHPLPCVVCGEKRKVVRIIDATFERWINEEEELNAR